MLARTFPDISLHDTIAGFSLQSWLFARLVQVFQFTGQKLVDAANFWALMFFILALAMATFYFMLGFSSNSISMVSLRTSRIPSKANCSVCRVQCSDGLFL